MPVGFVHFFIRKIATTGLETFFREIHVVGEENVPKTGPLIVCCTHHNMMIDPAVLSHTMPEKRPLMYWAKASLFKNPIAGAILRSAGVIPVDRGSKDNQKLFAGTFKALAAGDAVALFPEGTSYTLPRIVQVKDGAAWSALEYMKWAIIQGRDEPIVVVPAGINYTDKSKYRSSVCIEFGKPIYVSDFKEQFLSDVEGEPRMAVKRLTHLIEQQMVELTVNAPDWGTLLAGRTARDLLWDDWRNVPLPVFKEVTQTLVDLFSDDLSNDPQFESLKEDLITYHSLLKSSKMTNSSLASLPLPRSLDPKQSTPLPSRFTTLFVLIADTISSLIRLPFFILPLIVHFPVYAISKWVAKKSEDEEESMAQSKVVIGLVLMLVAYSTMFWFIWALLLLTPIGFVIALASVYGMSVYHGSVVDDNYTRWQRLITAWRVLVGVWVPKNWDFSLAAIKPYTVTAVPEPNSFLKLSPDVVAALNRTTSGSIPTVPEASSDGKAGSKKPKKKVKLPPSRKLVRHVLRVRADAIRKLELYLVKRIEGEGRRVCASLHMAKLFGGGRLETTEAGAKIVGGGVEVEPPQRGWRDGREVVRYLRSQGAKIPTTIRVSADDEEWVAAGVLSSEGEDDSSPNPGSKE